jgi:PIN domain nuclease of toxin-antitoxin system
VSDRLLLDTNVLIWTISASNKISSRAKRALSRPASTLLVSVVSAWELVLKNQAGKLRLPKSLSQIVDEILYHSGWTILPMAAEHLPVMADLPQLHADPFDRLLIAQAQHEGLTMVTPDQQIRKYEVRTLW